MRPTRHLPSFLGLGSSLLALLALAACAGEVNGTGGTTSASTTGSSMTTSSTGGGSGGAGAGGTGGGTPVECAGATPVLASDGTDSGFARCPDGTIHRVMAVACNPAAGVTACTGTEFSSSCKSDADCTAKPHGRCADHTVSTFGGPMTACDCIYPCANDAECEMGSVCVCAGVVTADVSTSYCATSGCVTGADCKSGECGISSYDNGCFTEVHLACRAPSDMCRLDKDCNVATGQHCVVTQFADAPLAWTCEGINCMSVK